MQLLFDFLPIILFFTAYKFAGIFIATAVAMAVSACQMLFVWLKHHKLPKIQLMTFLLILIFGGATLIFHKAIFIKWKPTVIYWLFALLFLGSHFVGSQPFMSYLAQDKISLPSTTWKKLNLSWGIFFLMIGAINLFVVYHYSTDIWVDFKLFGIVGSTVLFMIAQAIYLARSLKNNEASETFNF
ncbi:MAG: septation protein A [Gammaproteobacteria bacterium]|nr:septation protein A [Gammaproteobacteria bacterium]